MVQGPRNKIRNTPSVHLDYIIHIQEIKPWPPSQSLKTIRTVLIQWEHGEKNSGSTNQVAPSIGTGTGVSDGKIEFNESFRLAVALVREKSIKGGKGETFQKNCIEFNLYEPRRDKTVKGQLLGTAVVDLAENGIVKESLCISAPINCKRAFGNLAQPFLYLTIQPVEKSRRSSSSKDSLIREASLDRNSFERVSLQSEEYAEEADVASFATDDDASSHSSLAVASAAGNSNGSSSPQNKNNGTLALNDSAGEPKSDEERGPKFHSKPEGSPSQSSSVDLSSDLAWISNRILFRSLQPSTVDEMEKGQSSNHEINEHENKSDCIQAKILMTSNDVKVHPSSEEDQDSRAKGAISNSDHQREEYFYSDGDKASSPCAADSNADQISSPQNGLTDNVITEKHQKYTEEGRIIDEKVRRMQNEPMSGSSPVDLKIQPTLENALLSATKDNIVDHKSISNIDRSKHGKSVRSSVDSSRSIGSVRSNHFIVADAQNHARGSIRSECKDAKMHTKDMMDLLPNSKIQQLEHRMKILEEELREAAAIEVSLYSVVAEHGSSMTKVHAPARRLSRLYFHSSKQNSKSRRASSAKSIISGLILVSKACGNDVPRLTFWLSNSIVLRVIISKFFGDSKLTTSVGPVTGTAGDKNGDKKLPSLKWESISNKGTRNAIEESLGHWEDPLTFVAALEKVEAWIFVRIIESIWWQTFTPHMQSGTAKEIRSSVDTESSQSYRRTSSFIEQQQGSFSLELWENAFRDACERICPVRAGGHECGCLPVLSRVIMEQLIARLDVSMFNAILRESADEIPTDPVADPISDAEVLPIPPGKASFGAGAQLKNAIGNWSRWLTDLFGINDDELVMDEYESAAADERTSNDTPSKCFHLLNALSDLMMLPKDLLLSRTVRKEVCPVFGPPLIQRVLNYFVPDEFCPDPIPAVVLEALNSEVTLDTEGDSIMSFPCDAAPIMYQPPPADSVTSFLGEIENNHPQLARTRSSVLKKSQTSDDELDELNSPLRSVFPDTFQTSPSSTKLGWMLKENGSGNALRYQLLRDMWTDCD